MTDERLGLSAGAWLQDSDEPAPDPQGIVLGAMAQVPQVRQVHASGIRAHLEREAVPVPGVLHPATDHHVRKRGSSISASLRFVIAAVVLLATGGLLFAVVWQPSTDEAVAPVAATRSPSPQPTAPSESPMLTTAGSADDGAFELTITTPQATWTADEPIEVIATFAYVGDEEQRVITTTYRGAVGFRIEQLDGPFATDVFRRPSCNPHTYPRGEIETIQFAKSGGFDAASDDAAFWRSWFEDPDLRLAAGTYRIVAEARYGAPGCGETSQLEAAITIEVVESSATANASPEATAGPVTSRTSEWGPLAVFTDPAGGPGGDAGLGPGTVAIGDRCVTIKADRAEVPVTLVWADDTVAWRPTNRRIVFTDRQGDTVRVNDEDRLMLGGVMLWPPESDSGTRTAEPEARWSAALDDVWVAEPDPSCPEHLWYVGEVEVKSPPTNGQAADRVIELDATGGLQFTDPDGNQVEDIAVTPGETITFRIDNTFGYDHNFYIGTDEELSVPGATTDIGIPDWTSDVQEITWVVPDDITGLKFGSTGARSLRRDAGHLLACVALRCAERARR